MVCTQCLSGAQASYFYQTMGNCYQSANPSTSITSPGYPWYSAYGPHEACDIYVYVTVSLSFSQFQTEACCDFLQVNGVQYKGEWGNGPHGVVVYAGTYIYWRSDSSVEMAGWNMWGTPLSPSPPPPPPPPPPSPPPLPPFPPRPPMELKCCDVLRQHAVFCCLERRRPEFAAGLCQEC
jgi:hypothetical protein